MRACGKLWKPTRVQRVIELFGTSTKVVKVSTDAGVCFLKGIGNPAGRESLAQELVGSELASLIGLTVPPFSLVHLVGIDIVLENGAKLEDGPAFVSMEIDALPSSPNMPPLRRLSNPNDIPLLIAFDTWIRNSDRCPPHDALDPTPNWDNLLFTPSAGRFEMVVFDHTHCFVETDLTSELADDDFVNDRRVYGAFPEFLPFVTEDSLRAAARKIAQIDVSSVREIIDSVPREWGPSIPVRARWVDQIKARSLRVEDYILDGIFKQALLGLEEAGDGAI